MRERVKIAVVPVAIDPILDAVRDAGGTVAEPDVADGIIWMDYRNPAGLKAVLASSPARWVQLPFAGVEAFFEAGVIDATRTWTCMKRAYGHATAEQALALMLAATRRLHEHVRRNSWQEGDHAERRLAGSTAVVIGTGGIGSELIRMLEPLHVDVIPLNSSTISTLPKVVSKADWIVLAAALTKKTAKLINAKILARMKEGAWIVNVARGGIVDTEALTRALEDGRIGGAALDVTDPEPLPSHHPLWKMDNVIITSHTANTTAMAIPELAAMVRANVEHFIGGEPLEGLIDPAAGY